MVGLSCDLDPGRFVFLEELHAHVTREPGRLPALSRSLNLFLT